VVRADEPETGEEAHPRLPRGRAIRFVVGIAVLLAASSTASFSAPVPVPPAVSSNVVVVTNTADTVNGDVSSVAALNANPGADGVSLREALLATDATGGSATVYIMFSGALNAQTIEVSSELPPISRDHVVLEGLAPDGSPARVTIDGEQSVSGMAEMLYVRASEVTVRWMRFTGADSNLHAKAYVTALVVVPGTYRGWAGPNVPGPSLIANVQIIDNVFDNSAVPTSPVDGPQAKGLYVGPLGGGANTRISGITVARNIFTHYGDDAFFLGMTDSGSSADSVVVSDNTFNQDLIPIELGVASTGSSISGSQVIGNTINGGGGLWLTTNAFSGTIDQTLIEGNTFSGLPGAAIGIAACAGIGSGDVISNTQIINNTIHANTTPNGGVYMETSPLTTSPPSIISGVTFQNDTFVNDQAASLYVAIPNGNGASGNQITDVTVRNSIFYTPSGSPIATGFPNQSPDTITNSVISGSGWAGSNGNINSNPLFADTANGDYHLKASSPAINTGTTISAPLYDLSGAPRDSHPDIRAFEFGAVPRPSLAVTDKQLAGSGTVTSTPAAISCGAGCEARFDPSATVTLSAIPDTGSVFSGWSGGGCSGTGSCTVTMNSDQAVTATFVPATHTLTVSPNSSGSVSGTGISCPGTCSASYASETLVTLVATPAPGIAFSGWSGGCSGSGSCAVTMNSDQSVSASFVPITHTLTVSPTGGGTGTVTSNPAGINCGSTCSHAFAYGSSVSLSSSPQAGSTFAGWSGACSGTGSCTLTMSGNRAVTATFNLISSPPQTTKKPPQTKITKVIINSRKRMAIFRFAGSGGVKPYRFQCKLDKKKYSSCRSGKTYKHLKPGQHTFRVRANDHAGRLDKTPAIKKFKIKH
jgi:hypothetical protein